MRFAAALVLLLCVLSGVFAQRQGADALSEYRRKNYTAAVTICTAEIAANPINLEAYVVLCWSLLALKRYADACNYALEAYGISRYDVRVIEILGEANYYLGKNTEALRYFQDYINLAPLGQYVGLVYYYIGEIHIRDGRFRHADIALSTAIHYQPENALWWTRLAYAQERMKDLLDAVTAYEKALSLDASLSDAQLGIQRCREALRVP